EALKSSATKKDIVLYHALMSEDYKWKTMEAFRQGSILLLLSTEAAGMGCDINNVDRIVQVKCPTSISSFVQRLDRVARDPKRQGLGILLTLPPPDGTKYADEHLKQYITTQECRRKVLNNVYGNMNHPNENCCDLCYPTQKSSYPQGQISFTELLTVYIPKIRVPMRTFEQKELAKEALRNWRVMAFKRDLAPLCDSFEPRCVMTDKMIQVLGEEFAKITTPADIRSIITWTSVVELQRQEVADILIKLNKDIDQ
ncbi:hypothetical protein BGZ54_005214, partial [Gamsiella multidivaricata]